MTPEYIFYALVIFLIVVCIQFIFWWWHDVSVTTVAMNVARKRLADFGIDRETSASEIHVRLEKIDADFDKGEIAATVIASLYLLKSELNLDKHFFSLLARAPEFDLSVGLARHRLETEDFSIFLLRTEHLPLERKPVIDDAAQRLAENLAEFEGDMVETTQKVAA